MIKLFRFLAVFLLLSFAAAGALVPPAHAQGEPNPIQVIDAQTAEFDNISKALGNDMAAAQRVKLRDRATAVQGRAADAATALAPQLESLDARLKELGEPSETESADIKALRDQLGQEHSDVDSAIKRGKLLSSDAGDAVDSINRALAEEFNRNTFERTASPLSAGFWMPVLDAWPADTARLAQLGRHVLVGAGRATSGSNPVIIAVALAIALVIWLPVRRRLRAIGRKFAIDHAPGSRARRSGLALWFVLVGTVTAIVALYTMLFGLRWGNALMPDVDAVVSSMVLGASFGAFIVSLGAGLLLVDQPSWRLLDIDDDVASTLRPYPLATAIVGVLGLALIQVNGTIAASPPATAVANLAIAIAYAGLNLAVLLAVRRLRRRHPEAPEAQPSATRSLVTLASLAGWATLVVSLVAALQGYINFSLFLGRETIWVAMIAAGAYLLVVVADDFSTMLLSGEGWVGRFVHGGLGIRKSRVNQVGVVVSAFLRITIVVLALSLVFAPFGPGTGSVFSQLGDFSAISIGGFTLAPGAILRALIALALGIAAVRLVRRWLDNTYLPTTELDAGARNSAGMIVSYAGIIFVGFWALASLGIGVERIALVVSALSVGIGFGLQAITQNFISGLILLAERPVKIGDTVRIGTDEGDVKRISVRATEIQIADRSTLIVPNSELITKTIRNMTLADPLGRIQIAFTAPIAIDVLAVRKHLLEIFDENAAVLDDPKPSVFIDAITDGKVAFNAIAFVSGPRQVYSTRSALLFAILEKFRTDEIQLTVA